MWDFPSRLRAALKTKIHPNDVRKAFQGSWSELLHQVFHLRLQHHILGKSPCLLKRTLGLQSIHRHDMFWFRFSIRFWVGTLLAVAGNSLSAILFDFIGLDDFTPAGSLLLCTCSRCHPSTRFCLRVDNQLSCLSRRCHSFPSRCMGRFYCQWQGHTSPSSLTSLCWVTS